MRGIVDDDEFVGMMRMPPKRLDKEPVVLDLVVHCGDDG